MADPLTIEAEVSQISWTAADFMLDCPPLVFRLLDPLDSSAIGELYTNGRIQQFIAPALTKVKAHRRFCALRDANNSPHPDKLYLSIADKNSNEALGMFAVFNFAANAASCEFGIMLTEKAQGRGVARHALSAILSHMQQDLGIVQIFCEIHQQNLAAQRLARQCQLRVVDQSNAHTENNLRYVLDQPIRPWLMP